jgi:tetratricopeptide (TPR) repeat protein
LALDRDGRLKKAEKLLRQGRLDLAAAEYLRVVEDNPLDWSTANTLGELYVKVGQPAQAVEQYSRIAGHFVDQGFYPKAAALYRKILKIVPDDEATQIRLADVSARHGLLADAKSLLKTIAAKRTARGDRRGAAEMVVRLGTIDPADFDARLVAARTLEEMGEDVEAGVRFKALHDDLREKGRIAEAIDCLKQFVRLNPFERGARSLLAKAALERGDLEGAREFLDEHSAGDDPELLFGLAEIELRSGQLAPARGLLDRLLATDPARRAEVSGLGWSFMDASPETAFTCLDAAVDGAIAAGDFSQASTTLQEFVARVPGQIPALLKLVEVCVDGGLESAMYEAQEKLTDAYLAADRPAEARVIAEDLVAREPWEPAHIDRFRQALVMLRVSDPDALIAERLSGQAPFMAHDPFFAPPAPAPEPKPEETSEESRDQADPGRPPTTDAEQAAPDQPRAEAADAETAGNTSGQTALVAITPADSRGGDEIDLTGELGNLDGGTGADSDPPQKLDQVFSSMREEASDDADFSDQHMTLARTYLEIGMLDEAQSSLETAVRSPRQRFEAAAALGRLYERREDPTRAIEWLERAAEAAAPTPEDGRNLLYDLGLLLERVGETSRALAVFLELQSDAGDYRDVPARIDRLARVQTGG